MENTIDLTTIPTVAIRISWPEGQGKVVHFLETWKNATTKTKEVIDRHFEVYKDAGIGIVTGKISGLTVIDFDTKNNELIALLAIEAPTYIVETKKGFHYYYKYNADAIFAQGTKRFGPGVDVRNDGGVIFAPPTQNYTAINDEPVNEMTQEGIELLRANATTGPVASKDLKASSTRNDDLFRAGCGWINHYSEDEVWDRMVLANKNFRKGELSVKELTILFEQVRRYKKKDEQSVCPIDQLQLLSLVLKNKTVYPKCLQNCNRLLLRHPEFQGTIRFDAFTNQEQMKQGDVWEQISDNMVSVVQARIQELYPAFASYGSDIVRQSLAMLAEKNTVDTAKDWIEALKWDGTKRLESFFAKAYGVEDSLYHQLIGKNFFLGIAARMTIPGCHHRFVLILEGEQNTKKSKSLRAIAGDEWFLEDAPLQTENVSFFMSLWGKTIVEFSEGAIFRKVEMERIKSLVSNPVDTIVKKWGRYPVNIRRRCVFAITTNHTSYLSDRTGNTRFFPVRTVNIDLDYITRNREQLFAEACLRVKNGEKWWDESEEAVRVFTEAQDARMADFTIGDKIEAWVSEPYNLPKTVYGFLLHEMMDVILDGRATKADEMVASEVLREKGFAKDILQKKRGEVRGRFWRKCGVKMEDIQEKRSEVENREVET